LNTDPKAASTHPNVHALIRARWSPRAFSDKEVPVDDLTAVLDAARWAASSYNEQPWRFIIATKQDPEAYQRLLGLLLPFNQAWAKTAPVLILMAAKKTFTHNQTPNKYALHDTGAALANLFLQATALGLHAHGMAGFDYDRARSELKIPDDYETAAFVALGYAGSPHQLPDAQKKAELSPRSRKPLSEIAFTTTWETPFPL
jgi:nitroreductase